MIASTSVLALVQSRAGPEPGGTASARQTCPIECGPGWAAVVDRTCVRIGAALPDGETFRFGSIRQRQGALRIAWGGRLLASEAAVHSAVDLARARSMCVGEFFGTRYDFKTDTFVEIDVVDALACGEA